MRVFDVTAFACLTLFVGVASVHAQAAATPQTATGAFVTMLGKDTVAIEQFRRTGSVLEGDYVTRPGGTVVSHYVMKFDVNYAPASVTLTQQRADGKPIPNGPTSVTMTVGDKETVVVIQRDTAITRRFAVSNTYPLLGTSLGMFEVAFTKLRKVKWDSTSFAGLPMNARELPDPIQVKFFATDSVRLWSAQGPLYLQVDATGRVLGLNGDATAAKIHAQRVASLDMRKLIQEFGAADAAGRGMP
ncbi:MAG: hypothetical protein ABI120_17365 [Gemmatimonadaceae bacterium]